MSFSLPSSPVYAVGLQPQEIFSLFSEFILHGSKSVLNRGVKFIADLCPSWNFSKVQKRLGEKIQCTLVLSSVLILTRNGFCFIKAIF